MVGLTNRVTNLNFQGATKKQTIAPMNTYRPVPQTQVSFGEGFTLRLVEKFFPGVKKERKGLEQTLKDKGKEITNNSKVAINSTVSLLVEKTPTPEKLQLARPLISPKTAAAINADIKKKQVQTMLERLLSNAKQAASTLAEIPSKALALTKITTTPTSTGNAPVDMTKKVINNTMMPAQVQSPIQIQPVITPVVQTISPVNTITSAPIIPNNSVIPKIITPAPPMVQSLVVPPQVLYNPAKLQSGNLNVVT